MSQPKTPEELNAEFIRIAADLGDGIAEAVAAAVAGERADVAAWLRQKATDDFCAFRVKEACDAEKSADAIEHGEHVGWAKRVKP